MTILDLQGFVQKDPKEILADVKITIAEHKVPDNDFNWLGLAEVASTNTQNNTNSMETSLAWAQIAILVYEYLSSASIQTDRNSFECSAMLVRVYCIGRFGKQKNKKIRDPQIVVDWFLSNTSISLDEAEEQAKRDLSLNQILELRQIKNRLNVLKELYKDGNVPANSLSSIENWLAIRPELP